MRRRLSIMMFLEYLVPGAIVPIMSLYLQSHLHFEPYQAGIILATTSGAAFIAPLIMSHIADRLLSAERVLVICHILSAVCMLVLAQQTQFWPFLLVYLLYNIFFIPTFGLTNTIALHHIVNARKSFGGIRMWGTAGWVCIAWVFSFLWLRGPESAERLPHALYVSAIGSIIMAVYSLRLPTSVVKFDGAPQVPYREALKVFMQPGLILLCFLVFTASMSHQFYYYGMSPFLSHIGFDKSSIMPAMSIGQLAEVLVLGMLGLCLMRLSTKQVIIIGLLAQGVRYLLFAQGGSTVFILIGIALHGICYAFIFTTAYLYVDQHSTPGTRAGTQQLFTMVISGLGTLAANLGAGFIAQLLTTPGAGVAYPKFWLVPAILSLASAGLVLVSFRETKATAVEPEAV